MRLKIETARGRARLLRELIRAAFVCVALAGLPQLALAAVTVSAAGEGQGKSITLHEAAGANAAINGRTLTITFAKPFDGSLDKVADALNGMGSFVRLSADQKTLRVNLLKDMQVTSEGAGNDVVLHLTPGTAPNPAATASASATPQSNSVNLGDDGAPEPIVPQVDQPDLVVSEGPDYTRLRFEFPLKTSYTASLAEGQLSLAFKSDKPVRLSQLRVDPPPRVRSATGKLADGTFTATIGVKPGVSLRQSTEANMIMIDLVDPPKPVASADAHPPADDNDKTDVKTAEANAPAAAPEPPAVADAKPAETKAVAVTPPANGAVPASSGAAAPMQGAQAGTAQAQPAKPPAGQGETGATSPLPDTVDSMLKVKDVDVSMLDARLKDPNAGNPPPTADDAEDPADTSVAGGDADVAPPPPAKFTVTVSFGNDANRVRFPWGSAVPTAVIRRGERLWIAFGAKGDIDLSPLNALSDKGVLSYGIFPADGATVVGLQLDDHILGNRHSRRYRLDDCARRHDSLNRAGHSAQCAARR